MALKISTLQDIIDSLPCDVRQGSELFNTIYQIIEVNNLGDELKEDLRILKEKQKKKKEDFLRNHFDNDFFGFIYKLERSDFAGKDLLEKFMTMAQDSVLRREFVKLWVGCFVVAWESRQKSKLIYSIRNLAEILSRDLLY